MSGFQKNDKIHEILHYKKFTPACSISKDPSVHPLSSTLIVSQKIKTWAEPFIITASQLE